MSAHPPHPGFVLDAEYMSPRAISQNQLARAIGVSPRRINLLVHGQRAITAETALLLSQYFGTTAEMWIDMQSRYDLALARQRMQSRLDHLRSTIDSCAAAADPRRP